MRWPWVVGGVRWILGGNANLAIEARLPASKVSRSRGLMSGVSQPQRAKKNPATNFQLPEIGSGGSQNDVDRDDVDRVAFQPAQEAAPHAMVTLEMPDLWLDCTAPSPAFPFAM